jgi:putative protein kinase ArgK-like GTPase of G3E family
MLTLLPVAGGRVPSVLGCSATRREGVEAVVDALEVHAAHLAATGEGGCRRRRGVEARVLGIARDLVERTLTPNAALLERVERRDLSPHACARALLAEASDKERGDHVRP